jgi:hypothetical protein
MMIMNKEKKSFWIKNEDQKGRFSNGGIDTFDQGKSYVGIRIQQGVPLLDRDWNESDDLMRYQLFNILKYYVGNCSPDDGFLITGVPPDGQGAFDFEIGAGRMLAMGIEAFNNGIGPNEKPTTYLNQFNKDPDSSQAKWPEKNDKTSEVWIYLDAWIVEINSVDDPDLENKIDVDVETCVRHKVEWSVRVRGSRDLELEDYHCYANLAMVKRNNEDKLTVTDRRGKLPWLEIWEDKQGPFLEKHDYIEWQKSEFQLMGFLITGVPPDGLGVVDFNIGAGRRMLAKGVEAVNNDLSTTYQGQKNKDPGYSQAEWPDKNSERWIYLDAWIGGTGDQHNVEWSVRVRNTEELKGEDDHYYSDLALVTRNEEGKLTVTDKR